MPPIPLLREINTEEQWLEMLNTEVNMYLCRKNAFESFKTVTKTFTTQALFVTRHFVLEMLQLATHTLVSKSRFSRKMQF